MGEAASRGTYEDRRDMRLNEMIESAEVIVTLRVLDGGQAAMSTLARDNPVDEGSSAVAFVEFLIANFKELMGQALALKTTAKAGELAGRPDLNSGMVILPGHSQEKAPVILGADGGALTAHKAQNLSIELPASVKWSM